MDWVFNKTIETAKGVFKAGQALPEHWNGPETRKQLREKYGDDVLVESKGAAESFAAFGEMLASILSTLRRIENALNVEAKSEGNGEAAPHKRAGRPRKPIEAAPSA